MTSSGQLRRPTFRESCIIIDKVIIDGSCLFVDKVIIDGSCLFVDKVIIDGSIQKSYMLAH